MFAELTKAMTAMRRSWLTWGRNLVNEELREGKQHCQRNTLRFLRKTIELCRQFTNDPLLIRLDSGNDSTENIGILLKTGCYFIIKRNLRCESQED